MHIQEKNIIMICHFHNANDSATSFYGGRLNTQRCPRGEQVRGRHPVERGEGRIYGLKRRIQRSLIGGITWPGKGRCQVM